METTALAPAVRTGAPAARCLAVVLSDGEPDAAARSVAAAGEVGLRAWVVERRPEALAAHARSRAALLAVDWQDDAGADDVVAALDGVADWVVVLGAGERLVVDHPLGLAGALAGLPAGPVRLPVPGGAEVRLHPPAPGLPGALGGPDGPLADGLRVERCEAPTLRLHLGCGPNKFPGWVNVDVEEAYEPDLVHDLSRGLPVDDGTVELIYSEHFWEHLRLDHGVRLMAECRRALRPGGVLRIAMPDLAEVVRRYLGDWRGEAWIQNPAYNWIDTPARMINACFREWGHQYLYDAHDLEHRLRGVGFTEVRRCTWGESTVPELRGLETRPESILVVEAVK